MWEVINMEYTIDSVIEKLKSYSVPENKAGMAKFGIETKYALGVSIPNIRKTAKQIGKDHTFALELWKTKVHEVRMVACLVADPKRVTEKQMEEWVKEFNSWDVCDHCCMNLFDKTVFAYEKAVEWAGRDEEFVKRAGYVLMASLALHDKKADDAKFEKFLPIIKKGSNDDRNFVKKAVNWALRQIGKRNLNLNKLAIKTANDIKKLDSKSAKWIASDALRELQSEAIKERLKKKG